MVEVKILPENLIIHAQKGISIRDLLHSEGILIDYPCGGKGLCKQCRVEIQPPTKSGKSGKDKLTTQEIEKGIRLACQARIESSCTINIPEGNRVKKTWENVSHSDETWISDGESVVCRKHVELPEPTIEDQRSDWQRLSDEVEKEFSIHLKQPRFTDCYTHVSRHLRQNGWKTDLILEDGNLLRCHSSHRDSIYGIAIDLGTTTIDLSLHDLQTGRRVHRVTLLNKQTVFGADVISRAQAFHNDGKTVRNAALETIQEGADQLLNKGGLLPKDIYRTTVAGNPIMLHILHDFDPYQVTMSPYIPIFSGMIRRPPADFGFSFQKQGWVETLPIISAFVGADTVGMIVALELDKENLTSLSIDVGTNGEIVLSEEGSLTVTSTAAGPAFEGAEIACGMRAVAGAINKVTLADAGNIEYTTMGDKPPRGLCGTGLISSISALLEAGIIDQTGRLLDADETGNENLKSGIISIGGAAAFAITEDCSVYITQKDIRELQLAKGAIRTGIDSLLAHKELSPDDLDVIRLAGNFGFGLDIDSAIRIGLVPPVEKNKINVVGNAALRGAALVLVSKRYREAAKSTPLNCRFLELAAKPEFQMRFAEAMLF